MNPMKLWFQHPYTRLMESIILKFPQGTTCLPPPWSIFVGQWILSIVMKCKVVAPVSTVRPEGGRSTTIVLCFWIKYRNMTQAALDHARSVRPRVLLAPAQWQAVKMFSELNRTCLSIQSLNPTCSAVSYEESSEISSMRSSRCLSIQSSDENSITSDEESSESSFGDPEVDDEESSESSFGDPEVDDEESSESSFGDPEVDGYITTEFDSEHFVLPRCGSMLSRPTSPTSCSDAVFISEEDLEGYETYADDGKDVVKVQVVVRQKPIMRKLSCFLGSLKVTGNCEPPSGRLTEVRACLVDLLDACEPPSGRLTEVRAC